MSVGLSLVRPLVPRNMLQILRPKIRVAGLRTSPRRQCLSEKVACCFAMSLVSFAALSLFLAMLFCLSLCFRRQFSPWCVVDRTEVRVQKGTAVSPGMQLQILCFYEFFSGEGTLWDSSLLFSRLLQLVLCTPPSHTVCRYVSSWSCVSAH